MNDIRINFNQIFFIIFINIKLKVYAYISTNSFLYAYIQLEIDIADTDKDNYSYKLELMNIGRIISPLRYFSNMRSILRERIESKLQPIHLQIEDESRYHSRGQETHFNMVIVSQQFQGLSKIKKHQLVYQTLDDLMGKIHALTLTCQIQSQYRQKKQQNQSPGCSNKVKKQ